ncbi:hypothetical protein BC941DRAFT_354700 [Chlamydoabsidia padenii]|nr:hypothetical protein BC941DRAFT_354700 [Chlamydoabsidia padenii]
MSKEPMLVRIEHRCFECRTLFTKSQSVRNHLRHHGIKLPEGGTGVRRYNNEDVTFVKTSTDHPTVATHIGCPACVAHYANLTPQSISPPPLSPSSQQQAAEIENTNGRKRGAKRQSNSSLDCELLDSAHLSFRPPGHDDHLMVKNIFDATVAFHHVQMSISTHKWKLPLENHLHLAFAAISILFLPHNQYPNDLQPYFDQHNIKATIDHIDNIYTIKRPRMDMITMTGMIGILEDLTIEEITREQAVVRLLGLDLPAHQSKFRKGVLNLIGKLPRMPLQETINEYELTTRYIDPFLSGLFDDLDNGSYLRWTNEATSNARKNDDFLTTRPDLCISRVLGSNWNMDCGFGEAKSAHHGNSNYLVCKDLLRIGMFCKNGLDERNKEGVLGIQVIGRTITFYLCILPATGLYVMRELTTVQIPRSLDDPSKLVLDIPRVILVLDVFSRICNPSLSLPSLNRHTPRINPVIIDHIFSSSRDRKRACSLQHHHN